MAYTTLASLKAHLNIETAFTGDDLYLTSLISVVELAISDYCNGGLADILDADIPVTVKQAALLLAGNLYLNRSPVAFGQPYKIPYSFEFLLSPYRIYTVA